MPSVLVVDDDRSVRRLIEKSLSEMDLEVLSASTADEGLELLARRKPDVALLDVVLPKISGLDLFERVRAIDSKLPIIFITALSSSETAIKAMTLGAYDYLVKPLAVHQVQDLVEQAIKIRQLMNVPVEIPGGNGAGAAATNGAPPSEAEHRSEVLVGTSPQMQEVYKAIGRVAPQDVTVLIRGESGTGKELVARAVYQHSPRANGPFLAVNCAAIPDALLESELFGHEKGSFTGADQRRIGKFEQCAGGTIFLDEIGDMSPLVQSKVLRVLQEQKFERVGGNQTIHSDVRVIAATHCDLEKMLETNEFRNDLYYRLTGFVITLSPLRERREDLPLLLENFVSIFNRDLNKDVHGFSPDAMELLLNYPWPGNVRELQNVLKQTLLRSAGPVIIPEFLPQKIRAPQQQAAIAGESRHEMMSTDLRAFIDERLRDSPVDLYAETIAFMERYLVARVLCECQGNQSKAARMLGITRANLRKKIRALNVSIDHQVQIEGEPCEI